YRIEDNHRRGRYGYPLMAQYAATHDMGTGFAWCADAMQSVDHSVYVDEVHYTPEGNSLVAGCIADKIISSGALERARQRKQGRIPMAIAAAQDFAVRIEGETATLGEARPVLGPKSVTENLDMSK